MARDASLTAGADARVRLRRVSTLLVVLVIGAAAGAVAAATAGQLELAVMAGLFAAALTSSGVLLLVAVVVVPPDTIVVLSGRRRHRANGSEVGYRVARTGLVVRIPMLETATTLPVAARTVDVNVLGLYTRDPSTARVALSVRYHVITTEPEVDCAIERFLGREPTERDRVVIETVEGAVRQVVARLAAAELRRDGERVAEEIVATVEPDLAGLGLAIDEARITDVRAAA